MKQASHREGYTSLAARTNVAERLVRFIRTKYPVKTAENVAADTGLKAETIQKIMDRVSMPSGMVVLRLGYVYGAEMYCAAYGDDTPDWIENAYRDAELARMNEQMAALSSKRAALMERHSRPA